MIVGSSPTSFANSKKRKIVAYVHLCDPETGKQPAYVDVFGLRWSSATPSEVKVGKEHCFQVDEELGRIKAELRELPTDLTTGDYSADGRRRSEISLTELPGQMIENNKPIWNSYLFKLQPFTDPAGLEDALGSTAMSIRQLKPNSGGSPTNAHRITGKGFFRATTTSSPGSDNVKRYTGSVRMDDGQPHRIVERIMCHPSAGRWELWLDGVKIVNFTGAMGAKTNGYTLSKGLYLGALKGNLQIEYADITMMSPTSLENLITNREWSEIACPTCGRPY